MLLDAPGNDFGWSSWEGREDALEEIEGILSSLRSGVPPGNLRLEILFAPTEPIQEASLSSGRSNRFLELSRRFDEAMEEWDKKWAVQKTYDRADSPA